jgi:hypothetical protein
MLTTSFYGFLIVLASVLSAVVGLMLTQRLIPLHVRERHNTATGNIYAALYVMFGISVGFALYLTWQQYNTARQIAHSEAASVEQVYRLSEDFPGPERSRCQELTTAYARSVVVEEWPSMRQGRSSPRVGALLDELRRGVQDYEPHTDAQGGLYDESLAEMDEFWKPIGSFACSPSTREYRTSCRSFSYPEER